MFKGKTIINTQPVDSENQIGKALADNGAHVLYLPLIEIIPLLISQNDLRNIYENNTYHWLVFTSKNGVEHLFNQLQLYPQIKSLPFKTAVFGKRTATALKEKGFSPDLVNLQNTSADLLNSLNEKLNGNDHVLLVLGDKASHLLERGLKGNVKRLNVYSTLFSKTIDKEILQTIERDKYDLILFTSPSGYYSFKHHTSDFINQRKLKIACIGPTTENAIYLDNIRPLVVAKPSGKKGLLNEIENYFKTRIRKNIA